VSEEGRKQPGGGGAYARHLIAVGTVVALIGVAIVLWPRGDGREPADDDARAYSSIPRIDVHVHVAPQLASESVALLREQGIAMALNASGGTPGGGLAASSRAAEATGGRLLPYCNISFAGVGRPGFEDGVRETLASCKERGAVGLKIYKSLGLGIRDGFDTLLRDAAPRRSLDQAGLRAIEMAGQRDVNHECRRSDFVGALGRRLVEPEPRPGCPECAVFVIAGGAHYRLAGMV